jgi:hypothetical protein
MKRTAAFPLVAIVLLSAPGASACGDKLLHLTRLHRSKTIPVSVVVFSRPNSLLQDAGTAQMSKAFENAGHKLTLVKSESDLQAAMRAGVAEVLIADLADTSSLPGVRGNSTSVVAVVAKSDREGLSAAKRFDAVLKAPAKPDNFLDAVDRALESKADQKSSIGPKTNR